ncbi:MULTISPECIES: PDR/VanB family oxidoreductase [unclassified Nocardia]|uniref:PDR/VanB family oxidoreductase n=1 Tax=Nocardia TaxID=1817 RepID=UPI0007E98818|nr:MULTISPECIES: PDR/VanB family oxidoreductase [unclassified Nocardia]MBF6277856.1 oxidoreductase [Nocardia nova]OBA51595.1 ferredoxin [Nocardia sp. 852002-51101_SCH5132738]OBB46987.1 ferredoxin [Nocardia sp. 852002-51244_SCH5132740]OBF72340.1 ferredoxin [Mycobacterium sp. 852002-51759_SCH5129042]
MTPSKVSAGSTGEAADDLDVVVESIEDVAACVKALTLRPVTGAALPAWQPGSHIDVFLPSGAVRQYSLCGDRHDSDAWRIAVLREPAGKGRGGSEYIHTSLRAGTKIRVGAPRDNFALVESQRYLFIAGGIGITPILPMIAHVHEQGATWRLVYGGRTADSMAFRDELERYGDRVEFWPEDRAGLIDLARVLTETPTDTAIYSCGPTALLEALEEHCRDRPAGALHTERFVPKADARTATDTAFEVVLAKQDRTITIPPDKSILHTLEAAGVEVLSSCQQGMCGRCEQTVLEGRPDHRDEVLTPEERESNEYILICVSRCLGERLVLDL